MKIWSKHGKVQSLNDLYLVHLLPIPFPTLCPISWTSTPSHQLLPHSISDKPLLHMHHSLPAYCTSSVNDWHQDFLFHKLWPVNMCTHPHPYSDFIAGFTGVSLGYSFSVACSTLSGRTREHVKNAQDNAWHAVAPTVGMLEMSGYVTETSCTTHPCSWTNTTNLDCTKKKFTLSYKLFRCTILQCQKYPDISHWSKRNTKVRIATNWKQTVQFFIFLVIVTYDITKSGWFM